MRKLAVTFAAAAAILLVGTPAWKADAETWRGAGNVSSAAQNFTPIEPAACRGWGGQCRPGWHLRCGPLGRCRCVPCW